MPVPSTGGQLRTKIQDMQVGDYIKIHYKSSYTYGIGDGGKPECPVTGVALNQGGAGGHLNYHFYGIKVDKGLIIADRVWYHSVSWDTLNSIDQVQGAKATLDGMDITIRSLGGGNSYADADGKSSTTDKGLGAWPVDNEWDEYIVRKDYGGDGPGDDSIWHWKTAVTTWTQETPVVGLWGSNNRINRGNRNTSIKHFTGATSSSATTSRGFRPVFEYQEADPS